MNTPKVFQRNTPGTPRNHLELFPDVDLSTAAFIKGRSFIVGCLLPHQPLQLGIPSSGIHRGRERLRLASSRPLGKSFLFQPVLKRTPSGNPLDRRDWHSGFLFYLPDAYFSLAGARFVRFQVGADLDLAFAL